MCICYLNFGLAYQIFFVYFSGMVKEKAKVSDDQINYLFIIMGVSNVVGRITSGFLNDFKILSPILWYGMGCLFGGLCLIIYPVGDNFPFFAIMSGAYGLSIAMICCNQWLSGLHIFGIQHFTKVMGYLEFIGGIATLVGSPIFTLLSLKTKDMIDYHFMLGISGGLFIINFVLAILYFFVKRKC